jgi:hypothetical protein
MMAPPSLKNVSSTRTTHLAFCCCLEPLGKLLDRIRQQISLEQPVLLITDPHIRHSSKMLCLLLHMLLLLLLLLLLLVAVGW